jgi:hypothetical protein
MMQKQEEGPPHFTAIVSFVLLTMTFIFYRITGWYMVYKNDNSCCDISVVGQKGMSITITDWTKPFWPELVGI